MLTKELEKLGLNSRESRVYLALLGLGEATMQQITAKSGVKRTTVYGIIKSLKSQGLLRIVIGQKKILYSAQNPKKIEESLKEKQSVLEKIMPQLLVLTSASPQKTFISYFENEEGIKDIRKDILNHDDQEALIWAAEGANAGLFEDNPSQEKPTWKIIVPENKSDGIHISSAIRLVKENQFPIEAEIALYGKNKLAIMPAEENVGVIIENTKVFNTLRGIFLAIWESLSH
ncbi:MAG: helix-turn-helix domain-containing protein [Parcubacteria group bacterium]|jgi:sugar-specific transcriptional regulator TrmB